jgi:ferredoxin/flavodoxin---NADP+ reductase
LTVFHLEQTMSIDSRAYIPARLIERTDVTSSLALFRFRTPEPVSFIPGQYATFAVQTGMDPPLLRPYSIASMPGEDVLEVFVERVGGGRFTPLLWALESGDTILYRKNLTGRFVLDSGEGVVAHLMLATVTGVAPFVSMLRVLERAGGPVNGARCLLIHGASRSEEYGPYRRFLEDLDTRTAWFFYVPTVSRGAVDPDWTGEVGRVEDVLRKHADHLFSKFRGAAAYACGNPGMIDNAIEILERAGLPRQRVRTEKYYAESSLPAIASSWEAPRPEISGVPGTARPRARPRK